MVIGCLLLGIMLLVDWFCADNEKLVGALIIIRGVVTCVALLCMGLRFVWSVIIGAIWCFAGGVLFSMIGENREDHAEPSCEEKEQAEAEKEEPEQERNGMKTNELELFDQAIEQMDEDAAIVYGSALLSQGEMLHVMLGFKKLEKEGFSRSKELYLNLACRLSSALRKAKKPSTFKRMQLNEIKYALGIIKSTDGDNIKQYAIDLKNEQLRWEEIAN